MLLDSFVRASGDLDNEETLKEYNARKAASPVWHRWMYTDVYLSVHTAVATGFFVG